MKFMLLLDENRTSIVVVKHEDSPLNSHFVLLGVRDSDETIEFKPGGIYFNPLLKLLHPFVFNGENKLVSVFNGRPVPRMNKAVVAQTARGWFELPPRPLRMNDVHRDVLKLVKNTPKLTGVISQVARSTMNMRIPPELSCPTYEAWQAWFMSQQMVLTPRIRQAFMAARANGLGIDNNARHLMLTGREPERQFQIRFRWYQYKTVLVRQRQILESQEWSMAVPESVMAKGQEAILEYCSEAYPNWKELLPEPAGVEELSREEEGETVEGPLIWYRPTTAEQYAILPENAPAHENRQPTIYDLFREAIQTSR
jgi:hypothetical protein